jgi:pimeloyl-ACP methyl ester carboxylesterase
MKPTRRSFVSIVASGAALALCLLNLTPSSAAPRTTAALSAIAKFYTQKVVWTKCPQFPTVRCTWIRVPLDYSKPAGISIKIRVADRPANIQKGKLGALFTNPGGPGGPGTFDAYYALDSYSPDLLDHFDIVGFDPRGIGQSTHISCLTAAELDPLNGFGPSAINQLPATPSDIAAYNAASAALGADCLAKNPNLIRHVGTREVARDMDILRAALHQKRLSYLGGSYGTYLGAWYAQLFPKRVGRLVLDGAIDPSVTSERFYVQGAVAKEIALRRFLADCPTHPLNCPKQLMGSPAANYAAIEQLSSQLAQTPMVVPGLEPLTQVRLLDAIQAYLYDDSIGWLQLRRDLDALWNKSDGRPLDENAYWWNGKDPSTNDYPSGGDASWAIRCFDWLPQPDLADPSNPTLTQLAQSAPDFGAIDLWGDQVCAKWPVHVATPAKALHAVGAPPILVVGTKYDPATPYSWALSLSRQLPHARLLTWNGDGHEAYNRGSDCIDSAVDHYLLTGVLPRDRKVCPAVSRA